MTLTLVWQAFQNSRPHIEQELTFKNDGAVSRIGRADDNDFVVYDPEKYASRYHAEVYFANGNWYIEDKSSVGTIIERDGEELAIEKAAKPLEQGDVIIIGDCELRVELNQATNYYDPYQVDDAPPKQQHNNDVFDMDDFVFDEDEAPYYDEHLKNAERIDRPNLAQNDVRDNIVVTPLGVDDIIPEEPISELPNQQNQEQALAVKTEAAKNTPQSEAPAQSKDVHQQPTPIDDNADHRALKAFLAELNIDPKELVDQNKAEVMREAGILLRTLTQSMMEILKTRSKLKSSYRMDVTQIRRSSNNALKFSHSAEEAMAKMLTREIGYKGPIESAEEAVKDVMEHNMAMINGLNIAIKSTIDAFEPKTLEKEFEQSSNKLNLLPNKLKSVQYWNMYCEKFEDIKEQAQSDNSQFAQEFKEIYKKQSGN